MALDNNKPLGEQIDWADIAEKLLNSFNNSNKRREGLQGYDVQAEHAKAMAQTAQALETIVKRQEAELSRGTRIGNK